MAVRAAGSISPMLAFLVIARVITPFGRVVVAPALVLARVTQEREPEALAALHTWQSSCLRRRLGTRTRSLGRLRHVGIGSVFACARNKAFQTVRDRVAARPLVLGSAQEMRKDLADRDVRVQFPRPLRLLLRRFGL